MASFEGHALPGSMFIFLGMFIVVETMLVNYTPCAPFRLASVLFIALAGVGIVLELFWPGGTNEPPFGHLMKPGTDTWYKPMNWQHSTMYLFFLIFGVARLMAHSKPLLKGLDRLAGALAFGVEAYLFYNHVDGRSDLDTKIHLLITLVCISTSLVFVVSFFVDNQRKIFILDMIIAVLVFTQGTWFWHVAFILYGSNPWIDKEERVHMEMHDSGMEDHHDDDHDGDEHMSMEHTDKMFAVLFFAWHIAFAMLAVSLLSFITHRFLKMRGLARSPFLDDNGNRPNRGAYRTLTEEPDETPLLETKKDDFDDEHVLFNKA